MPKLPFWRIIKFAFWSVLSPLQFREAMRICWPFLAINLIIYFSLPQTDFEPEKITIGEGLSLVLLIGFLLFLFLSLISKWHRFLLLGERTPFYKISKSEIRYILTIFGLSLIVFLPAVGFVLALFLSTLMESTFFLIIFPILFWICGFISFTYGVTRLSLALPEAAIRSKFQFRQSWRAAKGNVARIFFATLIIGFAVSIPTLIELWLSMDAELQSLSVAINLIGIFLSLLGSLALASVLSIAYAHLIEPSFLQSNLFRASTC